jgi:glyceraldehyde 3-phosphate dehydrogenase
MAKAKIAINGFGRIGRIFLRQALDNENLDIVAINDLGSLENLAYLFKYDSVYRSFGQPVYFKKNKLVVSKKEIHFSQIKDPKKLPWKKLKVDIVIEATGVFSSFIKSKAHIDAGAKRVVITAPAKDADGTLGKTVLMGVNEKDLKSVILSSNASCTTNAASPIIQIMSENPGVEKAILNTIHGYTATQALVDSPTRSKDFRRGRAAAQNIVPSSTGAAHAVTRAIKELEGKFDGISVRVPVVSGSYADITFISKRKTSVSEINKILTLASKTSRWKDILKISTDPLVSSDIIGEPYGAIVSTQFTRVVDGNLVKILSWYDNEWGYVATLIKHAQKVAVLV